MKFVTNFPLYDGCLDAYGSMAAVEQDCRELGLDGLEVIWDHMPYTQELPPERLVIGYHLTFRSDWVNFWKGDEQALLKEFGTWDLVREYYHGDTRESMVEQYKVDLRRALQFGAEYVVFHVSDVSLEECFTYQFAHTDEEVCEAASQLVNAVLEGEDAHCAFLVENQWWPGLTFTKPAVTRSLLDAIDYENKGLILDTGHLLHTNTSLSTQQQAARYILDMVEAHDKAGISVRGMHLQQSLSGAYVEENGYKIPDDFTGDYWQKFCRCYDHILKIDRHQPWTDPCVAHVLEQIQPEWVNNELSAWPREAHNEAVAAQMKACFPERSAR